MADLQEFDRRRMMAQSLLGNMMTPGRYSSPLSSAMRIIGSGMLAKQLGGIGEERAEFIKGQKEQEKLDMSRALSAYRGDTPFQAETFDQEDQLPSGLMNIGTQQNPQAMLASLLSSQNPELRELAIKGMLPGRASAGGKYYGIPTSQGWLSFDKGTGNYELMTLPGGGTITPPPGMIPTQQAPVLPVGADPGVQGAVSKAKKEGQLTATREEENLAATIKLGSSLSPLKRLKNTALEIKRSKGLESRTGLSSYVSPLLQGEEARNTEAKMKVLRSQTAQTVLQMYRNMSQTGGAVGQVSNFEQEMFQNNLQALDQAQGTDQFVEELDKTIAFADSSMERMKQAITLQNEGLTSEQIMQRLYGDKQSDYSGMSDEEILRALSQ